MNAPDLQYQDQLLDSLFDELFPINRSISGPGLRQSLAIFARYIPLEIEQVPSGTKVFDWTAPQEWRISRAKLTGPEGKKIVDFADSNLHVVNYSAPVNKTLTLKELDQHLHSLPHLPEAVPYVTSYYQRNWGFCLSHAQREQLPAGQYHALIDSEFVDGGIDFAQCLLSGDSDREILLSSYLCHPSMANNELSGPLVLLGLYHRLRRWPKRRFSYRFLLNPETIGSLCFLSRYQEHLARYMAGGLVLTCLGGPEPRLTFKQSRRGDGLIDRVFDYVASQDQLLDTRPFTPISGSDERQFCAPGFNLPVGNLVRTSYGGYSGYHNSLDNKDFMGIDSLVASIDQIEMLLMQVEAGSVYENKKPFGEPHLSKYDLYPSVNSAQNWGKSSDLLQDSRQRLNLVLEILSHADGNQAMVSLAEKLGLSLNSFIPVIELLEKNGLLKHKA